MNRETNMSGNNERPDANEPSPPQSSAPRGPDGRSSAHEVRADGPQANNEPGSEQFIANLKQGLEETRLPPDLREQILAQMPPPEEQERLLREMQEKGGMSFDQFMQSLGLEVHPQP
jgi:hypothetical protein